MPNDPLKIEDLLGPSDDDRVLRLIGPLTITNLFEFQSLVRANLKPRLVIDFTHVPFIDSAGLGAMVGAHVSHQKKGGKLALAGVNDRVRGSMKIMQIDQFFVFYPTVEAAHSG
jgi:anti-sigma B factor antagonist